MTVLRLFVRYVVWIVMYMRLVLACVCLVLFLLASISNVYFSRIFYKIKEFWKAISLLCWLALILN